jgi:predicted lipoprotein with Yx(FWY)xxD motif
MNRIWTAGVALVLCLALGACEMPQEEDLNGRPSAQTEAERQSQPEEAADDEAAIEEAANDEAVTQNDDPEAAQLGVAEREPYGEYLVDGQGMSLYLFEADSPGESTCEEECAEAWPPVLTDTQVTPGEGVDSELVGTIERADGTTQVTYGGWPLYYFVGDRQPDVTQGHGNEGFGAQWYLVTPQGERAEVAGGKGS